MKYCFCGNIDGHEWAPNSQCCPDSELCSSGDPDEDLLTDFTDVDAYESTDSWNNDRLPPSLVEEYMVYTLQCINLVVVLI